MSTTATERRLTVADLELMPDEKGYELIDGRLVEKPPKGARANWIAGAILVKLWDHVEVSRLGWVFGPNAGYQCVPGDPHTLRKPNVSFVRLGRFTGEVIPEGFARLVPDLALEVVSA